MTASEVDCNLQSAKCYSTRTIQRRRKGGRSFRRKSCLPNSTVIWLPRARPSPLRRRQAASLTVAVEKEGAKLRHQRRQALRLHRSRWASSSTATSVQHPREALRFCLGEGRHRVHPPQSHPNQMRKFLLHLRSTAHRRRPLRHRRVRARSLYSESHSLSLPSLELMEVLRRRVVPPQLEIGGIAISSCACLHGVLE